MEFAYTNVNTASLHNAEFLHLSANCQFKIPVFQWNLIWLMESYWGIRSILRIPTWVKWEQWVIFLLDISAKSHVELLYMYI